MAVHNRALQVTLKLVDDRNTAKAGAGNEDAIGDVGTGGLDLTIERLDFLFKAQALGIEIAWRHVAPFAPGIVTQMTGEFDAEVGIVAQPCRDEVVG